MSIMGVWFDRKLAAMRASLPPRLCFTDKLRAMMLVFLVWLKNTEVGSSKNVFNASAASCGIHFWLKTSVWYVSCIVVGLSAILSPAEIRH